MLGLPGFEASTQAAQFKVPWNHDVAKQRVYSLGSDIVPQERTLFPGYTTRWWRFCLLHRHRFRQVARLIHIRATQHRDVVGEQLQRDG